MTPPNTRSNRKFQVAILYKDVNCAARAKAASERASSVAGVSEGCEVSPWRLDLLDDSTAAAEMMAKVADAELLVLALRDRADFTPQLSHWLRNWATNRSVRDAALAVFDYRSGATASPNTITALSRFAERYGLEFIAGDFDPAPTERSNYQNHWTSHAVIPSGPSGGEHRANARFRGWRINE
jgi:hypothetical protein